MMYVTKVLCPPCVVCGKQAALDVLTADLHRYNNGALAQEAFPEMLPEQREMIVSGTHPE